ncbi:MAG: tetratricopeptide repeat protein [Thermoanaerobaculia bacterium]
MAIQRDKIIASAEKLVGKGKIEPAIKEYERLLDESPNDVNTLNRIGDLWVRVNRTDEAVKVFTRIADHYAKDGFFLKAIAIFKKINKLDPSRLEIYAKLADLYAKQGLAMEAKGQYQVLADYYMKHGDPDNALKTFQKIAELDPNSINVHVKLADLFSQNGKTAEALKEYDRVGRMLLKRGMTDEAVQVFRKALKIDPKNVDLAESLANTLLEAKDFDNAQQILEGAHETNPDNPKIVALLGKVYIGKGELGAAEGLLEEGFARNPREAQIAELLADLHLRRGNAGAALDVLQPLTDEALGRGDRTAVEMLQRVLRVDAGHIATLESLVAAYEKLNEETNILSSMNSLAEAHISRGEYESASEVLERLIRREPENAQHREKLAFVRAKLGGAPVEMPEPAPPRAAAGPQAPDLTIDMDAESFDIGLGAPPPLPPPPSVEPPPEPVAAEPGDEDLDFITEQLTEAEVFAKYGLTEKAIEHLRAVLDRSPNNVTAYDKLLHVHLDEGNASAIASVGAKYLGLLRDRGDLETAESLEAEIVSRGFSVGGAGAIEPPEIVAEPDIEIEEIDTDLEVAAEAEPEVVEEIETDFEIEPAEEPAPAAEEEPGIELEIEEPVLEFDMELPEPAIAEEPEVAEEPAAEELEVAPEEEVPVETAAEEEPALELGAEESFEIEAAEPEIEEEPEAVTAEPLESELAAPPEPALEELGEVDFYIEQELWDDASERLGQLEARFPANAQLTARRKQLESRRAAAAPPPQAPPEPVQPETDLLAEIRQDVEEEIAPKAAVDETNLFDEEDDFFDLAAELEQELATDEEPLSIGEEEQSLEEIFKEFKRGVEQQLDAEDYDTHYNLGIAYKEMGLIDEAIGEFQLASKDPRRMIECCSMLGLCFLEKGMPQLAIKWYQKGLEAPEIGDEEHLGLLYDLGSAYLEVGDTANAQKAFLEVYGINSNYRDIVSRIKQLEDVAP